MDDLTVAQLDGGDLTEVVVATGRAFWPDPLFGHFARDAAHHHRVLPAVMRPVVVDARRHGEVWVATTDRGVAGSASWLGPGAAPRPPVRDLRVAAGSLGAVVAGRNRLDALRLLQEVERRHPHEPHWYLALLGVDPRFQGRGVGRALVAPVLARCDEEGLPAYLETQKEENLAFYARFGFAEVDRVQLGGGPPIWRLWREPRPDGGEPG